MRAELIKLSILAPKKFCGWCTTSRSEIPHYAYTWSLEPIKKMKMKKKYSLGIKCFYILIVQLFCIVFCKEKCIGQTPIDSLYQEIKSINQTIYLVKSDSLWGIVDKSNSIKIPLAYKHIHLDEKVYKYILEGQNGRFAFSDVLFQHITEIIYDSIGVMKTSQNRYYLKCWKDNVPSIIGQHGDFLFTQNCVDFLRIPSQKDLFVVKNNDDKWGLINSKSEMQIPFKYDTLILQQNKYINVKTQPDKKFFFSAKNEEKYGLIDFKDNVILGFYYDEIEVVHQDHFIVRKDQDFGSLDSFGKEVIPLKYKSMEIFSCSDGFGPYIKVLNRENLAGLYDRTGKLIIEEKYLYDSFYSSCHAVENSFGYGIEVNDGQHYYFFYAPNNYHPMQFINKEQVGVNSMDCIYIYTLSNNKKCIVGGGLKGMCSNTFEIF